jgi:hypothetical protein
MNKDIQSRIGIINMQVSKTRGTCGLKAARSLIAVSVALLAGQALAIQTVDPYTAATGGTNLNGTTVNVPAGGTVTFFARYSAAASESGLGVKVKFDGTKLTNVVISEEFEGCRIATAQVQGAGLAAAQSVHGWLDSSIRPNGAVGWPDQAEPATGCLDPGSINGVPTGSPAGLKLFKFTANTAAGFTSGTTTVSLESDGNYSYASTTPGYTNKSFSVSAGPAAACVLDVDANGSVTGFRDGLMILRNMAGLTGAAMVAGISGSPDPVAAAARIDAIRPLLDIDGNGSVTAFRDGLILIRMMVGLNGAALTQGVVTTGATRTSSAQLVGYVNATCGTAYTP